MKKILASLAVLGALTACGPVSPYQPSTDTGPSRPNPSPTQVTNGPIPLCDYDVTPPVC